MYNCNLKILLIWVITRAVAFSQSMIPM